MFVAREKKHRVKRFARRRKDMAARGHDKVAITGASGFLGSCIVKELLIRGYRVVGTVREPGNAQKTQHLTTLPHANTHLALVQADLIASEVDRFIEAFRGCRAVLHTASPFFLDSPSKDSLLKPALLGTEKILKAVQACPSVRKLIVTSSTAAIYGDFGTKGPAHIVRTRVGALIDATCAIKTVTFALY